MHRDGLNDPVISIAFTPVNIRAKKKNTALIQTLSALLVIF